MAILDNIRPVLPPRGSRHRQDRLVKDRQQHPCSMLHGDVPQCRGLVLCTSMDHVRATCPYRQADDQPGQKRTFTKPKPPPLKRARTQFKSEDACRKWNRYHYMDCPHGKSCAYTHVCSTCRATDHGVLKCPRAKAPAK